MFNINHASTSVYKQTIPSLARRPRPLPTLHTARRVDPSVLRPVAPITSARMFALTPRRLEQAKTYALQPTLPRLPVPDLEKSMEQYLKSLIPVLEQKVSFLVLAGDRPCSSHPVRRRNSQERTKQTSTVHTRLYIPLGPRQNPARPPTRPRPRQPQQLAKRHALARTRISHMARAVDCQLELVALLCT